MNQTIETIKEKAKNVNWKTVGKTAAIAAGVLVGAALAYMLTNMPTEEEYVESEFVEVSED